MKNKSLIDVILFAAILMVIMVALSSVAMAQVKAYPPVVPQTAQTIAGVDSDNDIILFKANSSGELLVSGSLTGTASPPSSFKNLATSDNDVVKASSGVVFSASALNRTASTLYLLLHNKATAPVNGDAPLHAFILGASRQSIIGTDYFTNNGLNFSTGISYCVSDNDLSCSPSGETDASVFVNYQ